MIPSSLLPTIVFSSSEPEIPDLPAVAEAWSVIIARPVIRVGTRIGIRIRPSVVRVTPLRCGGIVALRDGAERQLAASGRERNRLFELERQQGFRGDDCWLAASKQNARDAGYESRARADRCS